MLSPALLPCADEPPKAEVRYAAISSPRAGGSAGQLPSGVRPRRDRDDIFVITICPAFPGEIITKL